MLGLLIPNKILYNFIKTVIKFEYFIKIEILLCKIEIKYNFFNFWVSLHRND